MAGDELMAQINPFSVRNSDIELSSSYPLASLLPTAQARTSVGGICPSGAMLNEPESITKATRFCPSVMVVVPQASPKASIGPMLG
jgi:hypothetical protein